MKNKSIIIAFLISTFTFSCQKEKTLENVAPVSLGQQTNFKSNLTTEILNKDLILRISKSKNLEKLYDLSINDKESNKLRKGFKMDAQFKEKVQSIKSQTEFEEIVNEMYENPKLKIKQIENVYLGLKNLKKEFSELEDANYLVSNKLLESAITKFFIDKSKSFKPNPDQCFYNCQAQYNSSMEHSWNQFLVSSAACAFGAAGIWTYFACQIAVGWLYDDQFAANHESYGICAQGCNVFPN